MPANSNALKPTLLVGVGGTGCEIADRVYAMARQHAALASNRISILGFDTDDNDLRRHRHLTERQLIRTSTATTVFQLLCTQHARIENWFVPESELTTEIRQMNLLAGAGQLRMLSRLAFQTALADPGVNADIDNALNGLATHDGQTAFQGHVNVLIVGSLAGGTGSGMFLQTALLLNRKLREKGFHPETRGLFLLPDIFVQAARLPVQQIASVKANGYAALRELNALILHTARRSPLPVQFEYLPGQEPSVDEPPFASVTLLDYENLYGGNLGRNLGAYQETAARAAYILLFTPIGGRVEAVVVNEVRQRLAAAAQGDLNCFAGVGVGAVVYPRAPVMDYLTLRFGQWLLEGDWLELDYAFKREQADYHQRVNRGETDLTPPERAASYCRNLSQKAEERVRFFRDLYRNVEQPRVDDDPTAAAGPPQPEAYLDALAAQLKNRFWSSQETLTALRQREQLAGDSLNERDDLVNDVRRLERERRRFWAAVEAALEEVPLSLFYNLVLGGDSRGPGEWTAYHLQTYVRKGNPHPVQVRYFLYKVLEALKQRVAALDEAKQRQALEALEQTERFDNEKTPDRIESALERAIQIAESNWPLWFDRQFKNFANDYRDHFNRYIQVLRDYAERALLRRAFERLEQHLRGFVEVLERFFNELAALRDELQQDINQMEGAHQLGSGATDGNRYVFASPAAKRLLWDELRQRLAGVSGDSASNTVLTQALYARFQDEQRQDRWKVLQPFSGKDLYRRHIVEDFCRAKIHTDHHDLYGFHVIEAVRREASLVGKPWEAYLTEIVDLVCYQAEPYLALTPTATGELGERILFWALSPAVEAAIGNTPLLETLFKRNNGAQPLVEEEFSDETLLCLNTYVNLTLQQLRKLHPGTLNTRQAVTVPGAYYQAYQDMVQRMLAAKRVAPQKAAGDFTPHLDRDWHKPGMLPDIFPTHTEAERTRLLRGYVLGVALDLLRWEQRHGQAVTVFIDPQRQGTPAGERVVLDRHADLELLALLRVQPEILAAIVERAEWLRDQGWDAQGQRAAQPEETVLYRGLSSAETLARILRLSANRDPAARADEHASQALAALFGLFREQVEATLTELAAPEQRERADEAWAVQIRDALALLQQPPMPLREETLRTVRNLAEGTRARLLQEWVV